MKNSGKNKENSIYEQDVINKVQGGELWVESDMVLQVHL